MIFRKFSYSIVTRGIVALINFLVLLLSSRYLGVETRGEISLLTLNIANVQMMSEIFTGYALVHFIPKFSLKKIVSFAWLWIVCIVFIGTGILWFFKYLIPHYETEFIILSVMVILNTFCMVIILGKNNIRLYNWMSILQPLVLLIVMASNIFLEKIFTIEAYLEALFYSFGSALFINLYTLIHYLKKDTNTEFQWKQIFSNGFLSQWSNWMHLLANRFNYYILSSLSLQFLGVYSTATSLVESVFIIYSGISTVVLSYVSNEQNLQLSKETSIRAASISFILTFLALVSILLIPESWLIWILGKGFLNIKTAMVILSFGALMISYSAVFSHYFSGRGILKYNAISNTMACLFTILFSPVFIQEWGTAGAATVATVSYTIEAIFIVYFFMHSEKVSWKNMWKLNKIHRLWNT